jgi:hypothetical protein
MLVQSTLRSRLPGVFITGELRLPCVFITGESRLPGVFTTGELRLTGVFTTGELFWTPGSHFTDFKEHITIFKGSVILKIDVGYFNSLGTCDLCLQKLPKRRDSNRLPGVFITGESITNTNNSTNILKKSKLFLGLPIGTRRSCLIKKTGHEKSRDTVPLRFLRFLRHSSRNIKKLIVKLLILESLLVPAEFPVSY